MIEQINHFQLVEQRLIETGKNTDFLDFSKIWERESIRHLYAHNFSWLGRPIIQIPQDIYAIHEIIWTVKPDLVIETGIAHGGSLVLSASMLALLDYSDAVVNNSLFDPKASKRRVLGIDVDIRSHNRKAIQEHPMSHLIDMIEGSSISPDIISQVKGRAAGFEKIVIFLDANHIHDHVLAELEAYAPLTSIGSYCVVWDTGIEDLPNGFITDRPWGKGNNPKTAVFEYLKHMAISKNTEETDSRSTDSKLQFEIDKMMEYKLAITAARDGFLRRVR